MVHCRLPALLPLIAGVFCFFGNLTAQTIDTTNGGRWKSGFETGLEVTQTAYSDNSLRCNLWSLLQMSLGWQLLYDKEIDLRGRFKETLSLGLVYKFANTK